VIDAERSLHISFPRAKLAPTYLFTLKRWKPLVLRPHFENPATRSKFVEQLKQSVGMRYDYMRTVHLLISASVYTMKPYREMNRGDNIICTHQVYTILSALEPNFSLYVQERRKHLDLGRYGTFSGEDFVKVAETNSALFDKFNLFEPDSSSETSPAQKGFMSSLADL